MWGASQAFERMVGAHHEAALERALQEGEAVGEGDAAAQPFGPLQARLCLSAALVSRALGASAAPRLMPLIQGTLLRTMGRRTDSPARRCADSRLALSAHWGCTNGKHRHGQSAPPTALRAGACAEAAARGGAAAAQQPARAGAPRGHLHDRLAAVDDGDVREPAAARGLPLARPEPRGAPMPGTPPARRPRFPWGRPAAWPRRLRLCANQLWFAGA